MWHYQEFTEVHDGVAYSVYVTHGVEKLKSVFATMKQDKCAYMFGMIVSLRVSAMPCYMSAPQEIRDNDAVLEPNPLSKWYRCWVCGEQPSHWRMPPIMPMHSGFDRDACSTKFCYMCWHNIVALDVTSLPTPHPRMTSARCMTYFEGVNSIVAYHMYRDHMYENTKCYAGQENNTYCWECQGDCVCEHECECLDFGYYDFVSRAAHMMWMCYCALDMRRITGRDYDVPLQLCGDVPSQGRDYDVLLQLCGDVTRIIIEYVLSGVNLAWHKL